MSPIFVIIVVILAILAVVILVVGVSNDAINFLNSAIGSKVASFRTILIVCVGGIMLGVLTSHGMMEVARTGMFHPEKLNFSEVMMLYVGVMLTNVMLLDAYNKLGLPTSTTVSMIFGLLGAAVAVTALRIAGDDSLTISDMDQYVNGGRALGMISAILVSVVLAFIVGAILMYISRIIFTFRYHKQFQRWGAMWCGVALTGILYFAIFKGLKGSGTLSSAAVSFINDNLQLVLPGTWVACSVFLKVMQWCKVSIMKITILSGTFSLALAFSGNDLVNFIGVPLAGLDAFTLAKDAGDENLLMGGLANPDMVNMLFLLGSGVIMSVTLFFSRDAMRVAQTELSLASQNEEQERFNSTAFSRALVRMSVNINNFYLKNVPNRIIDAINRRFIPLPKEEKNGANYDKIRAVVNLAAASILICIGTSLKLPLSTTYVVFMVSMGSSLSDRVWGRDSAVYRISGVIIVIMGWFVTALIACVASFVVTALLVWGQEWALALVVIVTSYTLLRRFFKKDGSKKAAKKQEALINQEDTPDDVLDRCTQLVLAMVENVHRIYNRMLVSLFTENRRTSKEAVGESEHIYHEAKTRKYTILTTIKKLEAQNVETAHYYVQVIDYLGEVSKALLHCTRPSYNHINNNHHALSGEQIRDLKLVNDKVDEVFKQIFTMARDKNFSNLDDVLVSRDELFDLIAEVIKRQIQRVQQHEQHNNNTRGDMLFLQLLNETKTMVLQARNMIKSEAYFLNAIQESKPMWAR